MGTKADTRQRARIERSLRALRSRVLGHSVARTARTDIMRILADMMSDAPSELGTRGRRVTRETIEGMVAQGKRAVAKKSLTKMAGALFDWRSDGGMRFLDEFWPALGPPPESAQ